MSEIDIKELLEDYIDDDKDTFEANIFEEFDKNDVVNPSKKDIENPIVKDFSLRDLDREDADYENGERMRLSSIISEEDLEKIINFDEGLRKNKKFEGSLSKEAASENISELNFHKTFNDYLILPKISGETGGIPHKHRLPSDFVKNRGNRIEVADDPSLNIPTGTNATVIINRDLNGEIESIEVICSCGETTFIKLDVSDQADHFNLTEVYKKPIFEPFDFNEIERSKHKSQDGGSSIEDGIAAEMSDEYRYDYEATFIKEGITDHIRILFENLMINNNIA